MSEPAPIEPDEIRQRLQTYYEATASYQSRLLEASSSYNQVVVLAGYAGFFTIWSTVRTDVPHWLLLLSGGLMGLSLIVYVAWTVYGMVLSRNSIQRVLDELAKGPDGYLARVQAAEAKNVSDTNAYMQRWKSVLWSSGVPAAVAGLLLVGAAFASVAWVSPTNTARVLQAQTFHSE
jgi:hypothetical protein